jgi:hypothetical protein
VRGVQAIGALRGAIGIDPVVALREQQAASRRTEIFTGHTSEFHLTGQ